MSEGVSKEEIRSIIREEMTLARERRLQEMRAKEVDTEPSKDERLYLVTFGHSRLAVPDKHGRAILIDVAYARMVAEKDKMPSQFQPEMTIVAHGDGRVIDAPIRIVSSAVASICEVPESILQNMPQE